MRWFALFRLLTARGKIIVKWNYYYALIQTDERPTYMRHCNTYSLNTSKLTLNNSPVRGDMGCLLWVQTLVHVPLSSPCSRIWYFWPCYNGSRLYARPCHSEFGAPVGDEQPPSGKNNCVQHSAFGTNKCPRNVRKVEYHKDIYWHARGPRFQPVSIHSQPLISPWCPIYASMSRVSIGSDNGLLPIRHQAII